MDMVSLQCNKSQVEFYRIVIYEKEVAEKKFRVNIEKKKHTKRTFGLVFQTFAPKDKSCVFFL